MRRLGPPLFLAKSGYRRRRLHDVARLVPVVGTFLILLPILWDPAHTAQPDTARNGLYLFAAWAVLIAIAAILAPRLSNDASDSALDPEPASQDRG